MLNRSHAEVLAQLKATGTQIYTLVCGIPELEPAIIGRLDALGLQYAEAATLLLLFDLPCGFALQTLPLLEHPAAQVIVLTANPCPEYWEDLWERNAAGLLMSIWNDMALLEAMLWVARGECYREKVVASALSRGERALLSAVARGWDNERIADSLHWEEETLPQMLSQLYGKLGVTNRVEAALYYWGQAEMVSTHNRRVKLG